MSMELELKSFSQSRPDFGRSRDESHSLALLPGRSNVMFLSEKVNAFAGTANL